MKVTWNISLFTSCMICNFSKCDGFTVLQIISNSVVSSVLSLLSLLCKSNQIKQFILLHDFTNFGIY